jgi:hypothetical protein
VGAGTSIQAEGGLHIGNYVIISYDCVLWTINHDYTADMLPYGTGRQKKALAIENFVWIGRNAIIGGGLRIGEGAIVGMGAVVIRDVPPLAIVVGNPAQIIGFRPLKPYLSAKREKRYLWSQEGRCGACDNPNMFYLPQNDGLHGMWRPLPQPFRAISISLQIWKIRRCLTGNQTEN